MIAKMLIEWLITDPVADIHLNDFFADFLEFLNISQTLLSVNNKNDA